MNLKPPIHQINQSCVLCSAVVVGGCSLASRLSECVVQGARRERPTTLTDSRAAVKFCEHGGGGRGSAGGTERGDEQFGWLGAPVGPSSLPASPILPSEARYCVCLRSRHLYDEYQAVQNVLFRDFSRSSVEASMTRTRYAYWPNPYRHPIET